MILFVCRRITESNFLRAEASSPMGDEYTVQTGSDPLLPQPLGAKPFTPSQPTFQGQSGEVVF